MLDLTELKEISGLVTKGKITSVQGNKIKGTFPNPAIEQIVMIPNHNGFTRAKITSFIGNEITITPYEQTSNLRPGTEIISGAYENLILFSKNLLGCVLNALGDTSINSRKIESQLNIKKSLIDNQLNKKIPLRKPVNKFIKTGVPSIDAFLSLGAGQRIVLLAEPGVGKSTLLLKISEKSDFDLVIFALIGERGREVSELHEKIEKSSACSKSIIIASTSDESPYMRVEAANTAIAFAEEAASQGLNVLLAFDSLTRYIRSLRDVALSTGESPIRRGHPASIFERVPKLVERSGNFEKGSITSVYTMLTTSHLDEDPFVEEVKGLTDGHIYLSKELAEKNIYPAIDIRKSLSRLHPRFWDKDTEKKQKEIKKIYGEIYDKLDLLILSNQDKELGKNQEVINQIENFLSNSQEEYDKTTLEQKIKLLHSKIYKLLDNDPE